MGSATGERTTTGRPRRWAGLAVATLVGAALGIVAFTFDYAEGLSYLSNDPDACINCHVMQEHYDGWRHASHHANAVCNDCHVPHDTLLHKYAVKAEHGYRHSKGFTFNDFHEPIRMTPGSRAVVIDNCARCHASIAADTSLHGHGEAGPYPRAVGLVTADCIHCHSRVGHGPTR